MANSPGSMAAVKQMNRAAILRAARQSGGISRAAIAKETGLTKGGLTPLVEELLALGLLREAEREKTESGRHPMRLVIEPQACYAVAVDWTRTHASAALVDFDGERHNSVLLPSQPKMTQESALALLVKAINGVLDAERKTLGIAVVAPGPLDSFDGVVLCPPHFGGIRDMPVKAMLEARYNLPVFVDNNANAHALAEKNYGFGRQFDSFLHIIVDEGIGGGMVRRRALYRGAFGLGSELGHMTIQHGGERCACGNFGCAELYAAIPALMEAVRRRRDCAALEWADVLDLLANGSASVHAELDRESAYLADLLVSAVNLFSPQAVVLGSQIAQAGAAIAEPLQKRLRQRCFHPAMREIPVLCSAMEQPSLIGGASLVFDAFLDGALGSYESVMDVK